MKEHNKNKIKIFGYSGLIPFVLLSLIIWNSSEIWIIDMIFYLFCLYSLLIHSFLTGNLWTLSINQDKNVGIAIILFLSPLLLYVSTLFFFSFFQLQNIFQNKLEKIILILILNLNFILVLIIEMKIFKSETFYKKMRFNLTAIVTFCHISIGLFIIYRVI
tara:strand:- start:758 stop:1240 length:483 start_codon:yes stop_codon:yes gene_type:complete